MKRIIVGVAGGSGSGKTTLCGRLITALDDQAALLSCDDYYHCQSKRTPLQRQAVNYDHPDSIDFDLLSRHLDQLRRGSEIDLPRYCFQTHRRVGSARLLPQPTIVVEGALLLVPAQLRDALDLRIFLDADARTRLDRRLARDRAERGRTESSVRRQWRDTVSVMHQVFVEPTRAMADFTIRTDQSLEAATAEILQRLRAFRDG